MSKGIRVSAIIASSVAIAVAMLYFRVRHEAMKESMSWSGPPVHHDLDKFTDDTLRVLMLRDPLVWEEHPRGTSGLEFELLQRFAKRRKMTLAVVPFDHPDSLLKALWQGRGDLGAAQFVQRKEWQGHFSISGSYMAVAPILANPRERPSNDPKFTATDTAYFSEASPFAVMRKKIGRQLNGTDLLQSEGTEDDLLIDLVLGKRRGIVLSDLRAKHEAVRFPTIEFREVSGPSQALCFVTRSSSPQLLKAVNEWLMDEDERVVIEHLARAYENSVPTAGPLHARRIKGARADSISPFDDHFRAHTSTGSWRWELLAAMAWKETRFDSTVSSHRGAMGIMQFMPRTAERLGLDSTSTMDDHIKAAVQYLDRLDMIWLRAVPDKEQRLKFVLASYNAGPGHIIDGQRLAEQLGLDPKVWEGNVEAAVLLLAKPRFFLRPEMKNGYCKGSQVFHYVHGVLTVYDQLCARPGGKTRRGAIATAEQRP
ncbi:MAG: transglycosylase SLT domain-containing protein [Flavobacteriales bacterium]|nr:transglycosylase SLT domain-containing protein [Flavobacteriales bacterium]